MQYISLVGSKDFFCNPIIKLLNKYCKKTCQIENEVNVLGVQDIVRLKFESSESLKSHEVEIKCKQFFSFFFFEYNYINVSLFINISSNSYF